jgi:hypothetical protein
MDKAKPNTTAGPSANATADLAFIDRATVRQFFAIIHDQARHAVNGLDRPGVLQLSRVSPLNATDFKRCGRYHIGDIDSMVDDACQEAESGFNVFVEGRTVRRDTKGRGRLDDTVAVFALVVESDGDKGRGGILDNIPAGLIVQTSPGNKHLWLLLDKAVSGQEAKEIGEALRADTGTGNPVQPFRVAGLPNYPTTEKKERGRVVCATRILSNTGERKSAADLRSLYPPKAKASAWAGTGTSGRTSSRAEELAAEEVPVGDRSERFFAVVARAIEDDLTLDDTVALLRYYPKGCARKYLEPTDRLQAEVERVWEKAGGAQEEPREGAQAGSQERSSEKTTGEVKPGDEPLPLFPPRPPAVPYPLDALGPLLGDAARAIVSKVQVPAALAGQSVLATACLAAQAHADVMLPFRQVRPLSLYFMTIALSGDRKTGADKEAMTAVVTLERLKAEIYRFEHQDWVRRAAAWAAAKRQIENKKNLTFEQRLSALEELGEQPPEPIRPHHHLSDVTLEGLVKSWVTLPASIGIFTAEGGEFIGGYSLSDESRLRTAAWLSALWDGLLIRRIRATDGVTALNGRRLAMHLLIQPDASSGFLKNPTLRDQGLLSRFLVAEPDTLAGTRVHRNTRFDDEATIGTYCQRLQSILEASWPQADRIRGLEPKVLYISNDAERLWIDFHDEVELRCGPDGAYRGVRDFAAKAAEHAARIAGVLAVIESLGAATIDTAPMANGITLVRWYLNESLRLQNVCRADQALVRAQALLDWLSARDPEVGTSFRDVMRLGPTPIRFKAEAERALKVLTDHRWIEVEGTARNKPMIIRLRKRTTL